MELGNDIITTCWLTRENLQQPGDRGKPSHYWFSLRGAGFLAPAHKKGLAPGRREQHEGSLLAPVLGTAGPKQLTLLVQHHSHCALLHFHDNAELKQHMCWLLNCALYLIPPPPRPHPKKKGLLQQSSFNGIAGQTISQKAICCTPYSSLWLHGCYFVMLHPGT